MSKLFDKQEKSCGICQYGAQDEANRVVYCERKGVMDYCDKCKKFKYNPFARIPRVEKPLPEYSKEDFDIN